MPTYGDRGQVRPGDGLERRVEGAAEHRSLAGRRSGDERQAITCQPPQLVASFEKRLHDRNREVHLHGAGLLDRRVG
jgi:hypothetical protein